MKALYIKWRTTNKWEKGDFIYTIYKKFNLLNNTIDGKDYQKLEDVSVEKGGSFYAINKNGKKSFYKEQNYFKSKGNWNRLKDLLCY